MSKRIFVFGSNLAGRHGKGSALFARQRYGAEPGVGSGRTGDAFAIPTKDQDLKVLPLDTIEVYVKDFINYARSYPGLEFDCVAVGTGLAGYKMAEIARFFEHAPGNVHFITKGFEEAVNSYRAQKT